MFDHLQIPEMIFSAISLELSFPNTFVQPKTFAALEIARERIICLK